MAKHQPSAISERGEAFVEVMLTGVPVAHAAKAAGFAGLAPNGNAIRHQLAAARRWLTNTTQITRLDVIEGVIDGIEMARMQGDAGNVIKGWTEVAKILGHYAPEVKRIELSVDQGRVRSKMEALSDEELLKIVADEGRAIDGDCEKIDEASVPGVPPEKNSA